jgi:hypothetical protein
MRRLIMLVSGFFLVVQGSLGQLTFTISTDKPRYGYGEPIKLSGTAANNTDSPITIMGPYTGLFSPISFDETKFDLLVLPTDIPYEFPPGLALRWEYEINPLQFGLPNRDGVHTLYGRFVFNSALDSVSIIAPAYYGGQLRVGFSINTPPSRIQSLRDSMNATVLDSTLIGEAIYENWQTTGFIIDSLIAKYRNDARLTWIHANRGLNLGERVLTSVRLENTKVTGFSLSQNYPNPFNPSTTISYGLPTRSHVTLRIFNVLGQEVATLVDSEVQAGRHQVRWDAGRLASGVYLYRIQSGTFVETKKTVLVR